MICRVDLSTHDWLMARAAVHGRRTRPGAPWTVTVETLDTVRHMPVEFCTIFFSIKVHTWWARNASDPRVGGMHVTTDALAPDGSGSAFETA
jgi:hypothetical protein